MDAETLRRAAVLAEERRRALYDFVRARRRPVTRDEAAAAVGISRTLAAFHLDKLVAAGLLTPHYARPSGRGGPGAGRTSKLYEPSEVELALSVPERHYDTLARLLLEALETMGRREAPKAAVARVAAEHGRSLGERARAASDRPKEKRPAVDNVRGLLRDLGFEPYFEGRSLRLHNCPFDRLARRSPQLVCAMNLAFIEGLLEGLGAGSLDAVLEPRPDECCVTMTGGPIAS